MKNSQLLENKIFKSLKEFKLSDNPIGIGAFSKVYKALHLKKKVYYAMKVIKLKEIHDSEKEYVFNELYFYKQV